MCRITLDFQCYLRGLIYRNETSLERLINKDRNGNQNQNLVPAIMRSLLEKINNAEEVDSAELRKGEVSFFFRLPGTKKSAWSQFTKTTDSTRIKGNFE